MAFDYIILEYLSKPLMRDTFMKILRNRVRSRAELRIGGVDDNELGNVLNELYSIGLIDKRPGYVQELDKFFPTLEGLQLEKKL